MEWSEYKAKVKEALESAQFDVAEKTLIEAVEYVKQTNGSYERLCLCLDQLAWIYVNHKDLEKAAQCYKESMEIKLSVLGDCNPIVARACKKLATVVYMQKRYDLAEKYSKEALNIFKATLGMENEETQQTLADIVSLLRKLERNVEAEILLRLGHSAKPPDKPSQYEDSSLIKINVCPYCSLPFDGDQCLRCTEGRAQAVSSSDNAKSMSPGVLSQSQPGSNIPTAREGAGNLTSDEAPDGD